MNVRIISGKLGSRLINVSKNAGFHPMSERMRGALFNMLGNIQGKKFLDAFAGSGAVGLEAVSRGALSAICVEQDKKTYELLRSNIERLGVSVNIKVIRANIFGWVEHNTEKFDFIIADPPYHNANLQKTVDKLKNHLSINGIMVVSHTGRAEPPGVDGVVVVETRSYADGTLTFYQSQ